MANPSQGDLALGQFGEAGAHMLARARGQKRFPDHFIKERARFEVFAGSQVLEGAGQGFAATDYLGLGRPPGIFFAHGLFLSVDGKEFNSSSPRLEDLQFSRGAHHVAHFRK